MVWTTINKIPYSPSVLCYDFWKQKWKMNLMKHQPPLIKIKVIRFQTVCTDLFSLLEENDFDCLSNKCFATVETEKVTLCVYKAFIVYLLTENYS